MDKANIDKTMYMTNMKTNKEKTIYYFDKDPGYETLKTITKGYFTILNTYDGRTIYLNETGKYHLPINDQASMKYGIKIYGPIAIVGKVEN